MAPARQRQAKSKTSPIKTRRITRARAATDTESAAWDLPPPKPAKVAAAGLKSRTTKATSTSSRNLRSKSAPRDGQHQDEDDELGRGEEAAAAEDKEVEAVGLKNLRQVLRPATSTKLASLAAAPRRRVKVTPLEAVQAAEQAEKEIMSETKAKAKKSSSSTSSRTKKTVAATAPEAEEGVTDPAPKTRSRSRTIQKKEGEVETAVPAPKTRGRPKKEKQVVGPAVSESEVMKPSTATHTRSTRTRAGSGSATASVSISASSLTNAIAVGPTRKKVTFKDILEDDKENHQPVATSKMATAKKNASAPAATGMRAKPIRKPAAGTKTKKATTNAKSKQEEPVTRVLTPKRITQVTARPTTPADDDEEDELAGDVKTPIRDLSLSPKRGMSQSSMKALPAIKKLDFTPALFPPSPAKASQQPAVEGFLSPPRRPPPSPFKDALKESPRRGDAVPNFPVHVENATSNAASGNIGLSSPSKNQPALFQSPKRGALDSTLFPQSAVKSHKMPLKTSLFSSPAKRLFSPLKRRSPAPVFLREDVERNEIKAARPDQGTPESVVVSSHFRASVSPQRSVQVHRMSEDELAQEMEGEIDFDESVLNIRSPLKVAPAVTGSAVSPENEDGVNGEMAIVQNNLTQNIEERDESKTDLMAVDVENRGAEVDRAQSSKEMEPKAGAPIQPESLTNNQCTSAMEHVENSPTSRSVPAHTPGSTPSQRQRPSHANSQPRMSALLFRTNRFGDDEDSSEDELAADPTPDDTPSLQPSLMRSHRSAGVPTPSASRTVDFTPLAARMSGWLASSPGKRSAKRTNSGGLFSPLAQIHVEGEVQIARQATPGRKSTSARISLTPAMRGSPAKPDFFAEGMASQDFEVQMGEYEGDERQGQMQQEEGGLTESVTTAEERGLAEDDERADNEADPANEEGSQSEEAVDPLEQKDGDLTTDLINFTNASDTALVDLAALAKEADDLAPRTVAEQIKTTPPTPPDQASSTDESVYGDENVAPASETAEVVNRITDATAVFPGSKTPEPVVLNHAFEASPDDEKDTMAELEAAVSVEPTIEHEVANASASIAISPTVASTLNLDLGMVTPVRPDPSMPRYIKTVVSKVPLRPEGQVCDLSPIKVPKKRSRSLSGGPGLGPAKRRSVGTTTTIPAVTGGDAALVLTSAESEAGMSPERRVRSAAPSPTQSNAFSTPGQMSFTADDFGDSTLDDIDFPEEDLELFDPKENAEVLEESMMSTIPTPTMTSTTKHAKKARHSMGTTVASTPKAAHSVSRTPLKAVASGVLHGAVVYVDVHTSEGADASGIFVELLNAMGARCVKEWRWNPRASMVGGEDETKIGITHVVYKDGGKRTLEKVRDAKGQVWCVGVGWVLDCERESKWLEESTYAVDLSVLPRGGMRRRKSMEPRALINENGSLSAVRGGRRSVSAEMMQELINTPVRGVFVPNNDERETVLAESTDTEISSTYNSPAGYQHGGDVSTPTGLLKVDYDPQTTTTPMTPYLMAKGSKLMQMSAPSKPNGKGLFDNEEHELKDKMKLKLDQARRRTMAFKPVVGSPLKKE